MCKFGRTFFLADFGLFMVLSDIFWDLKQSSLKPNISGLSSGFYHLDSLTQGFQKSDLIIIAGRPGMGKTALCLNIALHIVEEYHAPIIFFSLEKYSLKTFLA